MPPPPESRKSGRNADWPHLFSRDVLSVPDKWEYPWFAAWDLAFHMIPFARVDPSFAKQQLTLLLREWYMHPNGQMPAYEFDFGDVNPPVHAWACWQVYKMTAARGDPDRQFLSSAFQKLLINFTWWVNRKDARGKHVFSGGFLGLDNIGVFDRSRPLPGGGILEQADGTAWMAFYCTTMLAMALELSRFDPGAEDIASKFFEHFVHIADAINTIGGTGLWNEEDGFYYDQMYVDGRRIPLARSIDGRSHTTVCCGRPERRGDRQAGGISEALGLVPHLSTRSGQDISLTWKPKTRSPPGAFISWRFLPGSDSSGCSVTCSTKTSSSPPTASARCRSITRITLTFFSAPVRNSGWTTFPGNRKPGYLEGTPTGAAQSGFR